MIGMPQGSPSGAGMPGILDRMKKPRQTTVPEMI
jgi:hypothetical protein